MPFGMLGFLDQKRFVLLGHKEKSPFCWYQSVDDPELAFVVINPLSVKQDYAIDAKEAVDAMSWENVAEKDFELYVVVNIPKSRPEKMTANLMGPIVINTVARQAVQLVLSNSLYSHQFSLL
jgi:flagellar assembly factor FliW